MGWLCGEVCFGRRYLFADSKPAGKELHTGKPFLVVHRQVKRRWREPDLEPMTWKCRSSFPWKIQLTLTKEHNIKSGKSNLSCHRSLNYTACKKRCSVYNPFCSQGNGRKILLGVCVCVCVCVSECVVRSTGVRAPCVVLGLGFNLWELLPTTCLLNAEDWWNEAWCLRTVPGRDPQAKMPIARLWSCKHEMPRCPRSGN